MVTGSNVASDIAASSIARAMASPLLTGTSADRNMTDERTLDESMITVQEREEGTVKGKNSNHILKSTNIETLYQQWPDITQEAETLNALTIHADTVMEQRSTNQTRAMGDSFLMAKKKKQNQSVKVEDGSNPNEILYESSIIESRLANVYNEMPFESSPLNRQANQESICNKETSSLESILEDAVLASQLDSPFVSPEDSVEGKRMIQQAEAEMRTVTQASQTRKQTNSTMKR